MNYMENGVLVNVKKLEDERLSAIESFDDLRALHKEQQSPGAFKAEKTMYLQTYADIEISLKKDFKEHIETNRQITFLTASRNGRNSDVVQAGWEDEVKDETTAFDFELSKYKLER